MAVAELVLTANTTGMGVVFLVTPGTGFQAGEIQLDPVIGMGMRVGFVGLGRLLPGGVVAVRVWRNRQPAGRSFRQWQEAPERLRRTIPRRSACEA